jgi:Cys-tRNA(Pro)/Cys-tRNA(Cys) deacylase
MTPAVNIAKKAKINFQLHPYDHDPSAESYGEEAVEKLNVLPARVFKTLVVSTDNRQLAVAVVPVSDRLNLKSAASALGVKKIQMADAKDVQRSTGYVLGGVSPLGQKKSLTTVIDQGALNHATIFVSAGRRGLDIELSPNDLAALTRGTFASLI